MAEGFNRSWGIKEVEAAINAFPKDSAPGFTSFRPSHLKDALVPGQKDEVLRLLADTCELLASGLACEEIREWIAICMFWRRKRVGIGQ